eukprot:715992-Pyramimonas_sp.AAC.1
MRVARAWARYSWAWPDSAADVLSAEGLLEVKNVVDAIRLDGHRGPRARLLHALGALPREEARVLGA